MRTPETERTNFYDKLQDKIFASIVEKLCENERVLDIGCGDCKLVKYLAKEGNIYIVGLDIDGSKFADSLKELTGEVQTRVKCVEGNAENLKDFIDENFSAVVSVYSLHEFKNPLRALQECMRVLNKKGKIIIVDFIPDTLAERLWSEKYFNLRDTRTLLVNAGFKVIEQKFISQEGPAMTVGYKERVV